MPPASATLLQRPASSLAPCCCSNPLPCRSVAIRAVHPRPILAYSPSRLPFPSVGCPRLNSGLVSYQLVYQPSPPSIRRRPPAILSNNAHLTCPNCPESYSWTASVAARTGPATNHQTEASVPAPADRLPKTVQLSIIVSSNIILLPTCSLLTARCTLHAAHYLAIAPVTYRYHAAQHTHTRPPIISHVLLVIPSSPLVIAMLTCHHRYSHAHPSPHTRHARLLLFPQLPIPSCSHLPSHPISPHRYQARVRALVP
jgi:hypothetical protein